MKSKKLLVITSILLVIIIAGCSSKTDNQSSQLSPNDKLYQVNEDKTKEESKEESKEETKEESKDNTSGTDKMASGMARVNSETNEVEYSDDGGNTWRKKN